MEFFQTRGGKIFFEDHVPRMVKALEVIAEALPELVLTIKKQSAQEVEQEIVPVNHVAYELQNGARWVDSFTDPGSNEVFAVIEKPKEVR